MRTTGWTSTKAVGLFPSLDVNALSAYPVHAIIVIWVDFESPRFTSIDIGDGAIGWAPRGHPESVVFPVRSQGQAAETRA